MSILRGFVLHCKGMLHLLARKPATPGEGVYVSQLLDLAPETQWFCTDCGRLCSVRYTVLNEDAWKLLGITSVLCWCVASTRTKDLSFHTMAIVHPSPHACTQSTNHASSPEWNTCVIYTVVYPVETTNAPSLVERGCSWCAVTYLYSHPSQPHCHRRTLPHPVQSHLHRYRHPRSGNPRDRKGWAGQTNAQRLLNQTTSSLASTQR